MFPNRTLCDVLTDMRKCDKTRNYSYLKGLIEEAQYMGNRMEAALGDLHDIDRYRRDRSIKKREISKLNKEIEELEGKLDEKRITGETCKEVSKDV